MLDNFEEFCGMDLAEEVAKSTIGGLMEDYKKNNSRIRRSRRDRLLDSIV